MTFAVALVGRPNVGKSTLFNRLTRRRDALVADVPGLTRDRRYGRAEIDGHACVLIDTGGLFGEGVLTEALESQTFQAVAEAQLVLLLLDARDGITSSDHDIVRALRSRNANIIGVLNKIDGLDAEIAAAEFAELGLGDLAQLSAAHGKGIGQLRERIAEHAAVAPGAQSDDAESHAQTPDADAVRLAVIGRPNVGKSTLINRLLGEERQVVADLPGTTMDAIDIPFERDGEAYVLIDTAGVRRKGRVEGVAEKFSVVKALQAMDRAHVVILVLDAREGIVDQDLHVLKYAMDAGCGVVIAVNKWDGLSADERQSVKTSLERRLDFVPWVELQTISALHGTGVGHLWKLVNRVFAAGNFDVSTSLLTRLLENITRTHPPPAVRGRHIKLKVAHKHGDHPPTIVVHGNQVESLPASYVKYLENSFREALDLVGNPVRVIFRSPENPYAGRRNKLTPRQERRRKRLVRHHKKR
jgi:GTP-binding protein